MRNFVALLACAVSVLMTACQAEAPEPMSVVPAPRQ